MQLSKVALFFASFSSRSLIVHAQQGAIEIQFEPVVLSDGGGPPKELLEILGALPGGSISTPASQHAKEAQLEKEIFDSLTHGVPQHHLHNPFQHRHGNHFNPPGPSVVMEIEAPPPFFSPHGQKFASSTHSAFPATMFRDLFPGPVEFDMATGHPVPFAEPDPLVQNLLKDLDQTFVGLMGNIQKAAGTDRTPNSCEDDIKQMCQGAKSKLHCLGQHAAGVSDACHKDIGKSVPFRCSHSIDKFCDVMEVGILQCLGDHMADLNEECKDAVMATHHVISKANTQKAVVVDTSTGAKKVSEPSATATPPPALRGAPLQLPHSVIEVLGIARSVTEKLRRNAAERNWQTIKEWSRLLAILTVLVFVLCRMPSTNWPERKLRGLLGLHNKEDEYILGARCPTANPIKQNLELPRPVDPAFA